MRPWISLAALISISAAISAQEQPQKRPTIGLVLEGGGALGLAHVGVLRWLEEHRIPIDYIGGTSMGGLVAGLYATGKGGAELEEFVRKMDWNVILASEIPYRDRIYRRKEDQRSYPNFIELGWRGGLALPAGINTGENVGLLFDEVALPYSNLKNFDQLPIPFRCVATELTEAKATVFDSGSLSEALRATMAIPGVFTPFRRDGKVYADGGLLENLPVDVVRNMGADIVIAVHLQVMPFSPKDISSPVATIGRSVSVVVAVNELRSMEKADVLIVVPLQDYTSFQFSKGEEIIAKGRVAPEAKVNLLSKFSVSEAEYTAWRAGVEKRRVTTVAVPEFIEVSGTRPELIESIRTELEEFVGQPVDPKALDKELIKVTGIGRFQKIDYSLVERNGKTGLAVHALEKDHAPPTILPSIVIDGSDYANVQFTLGARATWLDVGSYRTEVRADVRIGAVYAGLVEYYRPFRPNSKWFIAPRGFASNAPTHIYSHGDRIAEYRSSTAGGAVDIGFTQTRFSEFRAGYRLFHNSFKRQIGSPEFLPRVSGTTGASSIRYTMDRLDDGIVPREGFITRSRLEFWDKNVGATGGFPLAETDFWYLKRVSVPGSISFRAAGGTTFGNDGVGIPVFNFGGVNRMSAYGTNEFFTNQYWYGQTGYIHEIGRLPVFAGRRIFVSAATEIMKPYGAQTTRLAANGELGVLVETLIGPVFLGGAYGDSGHRKIFFQLGRYF